MSDNIVHISNTPIFDQLARELKYNRLVAGGPTVRLRPNGSSYISADAWIAKPVPQLAPPVKGRNTKFSVNFHPEDLGKDYDSVDEFMEARKREFFHKHPNAVDILMTSVEELDGTFTLIFEGYENTGLVLAKKPFLGIKADPEPVTDLTYDDLIEAVKKYTPKQTDETVNAASTDAPKVPHYIGWILDDKEDADEE